MDRSSRSGCPSLVSATSSPPLVACRNAFSHIFHVLDSYLPSFLVISARTIGAVPDFFFKEDTAVQMGMLTTSFLEQASLNPGTKQQLNRFYQERILIPLQQEASKIYPLLMGMVENHLIHYYLHLLKDPTWSQKTSFSQEDLLSYSDPIEILSNYIVALEGLLKKVSDLLYLATFFPFYLKVTPSLTPFENELDGKMDLDQRFRFLLQEIRRLKPESPNGPETLQAIIKLCKEHPFCHKLRSEYLESVSFFINLIDEVSLFKEVILSVRNYSPQLCMSSPSTDEGTPACLNQSFTEGLILGTDSDSETEELLPNPSPPLRKSKKTKAPRPSSPILTILATPIPFSAEQNKTYCIVTGKQIGRAHV